MEIELVIDLLKCSECLECVNNCPSNALTWDNVVFGFEVELCTFCETCMDICEESALTVTRVDI